MSVAFHASSTNTAAVPSLGSTISITKPTVSAGDVLVVVFGTNSATTAGNPAFTAPSGWTQIGVEVASTKVAVQAWWALQSTTNLTFTYTGTGSSGATNISWVCGSFTGVDNTTPVDATGTGSSNTGAAAITPANYSSVTDGALPLVGVVNWNSGGVFTSTGYTVLPSSNASCQEALLYRNTAVSPAGTVTGVSIADSAGATGNILCYQQFALRPSAVADTLMGQACL